MIIHQISTIPENKWNEIWKECHKTIQKLPYDLILWDTNKIDNLLKEDDEDFLLLLNDLHPIYKIDYVRYLILEKYGGAYFDLDVKINIDFIPLLNKDVIYLLEGMAGEFITNAIIITPKNHNIWNSIKTKAKYNIINNKKLCSEHPYHTINLVGPYYFSKWWAKHYSKIENTNLKVDLLGYEQFNNPNNSLSICSHYHTHIWWENKQIPDDLNFIKYK